MIAVDTNVLVRFLTRDDEAQYRKAYRIFRREHVFIPDTVLLETEWVLRYAYDFKPDAIVRAFMNVLGLENVETANPAALADALAWHAEGMDFADATHRALSRHCSALLTFDRDFANTAGDTSGCAVQRL